MWKFFSLWSHLSVRHTNELVRDDCGESITCRAPRLLLLLSAMNSEGIYTYNCNNFTRSVSCHIILYHIISYIISSQRDTKTKRSFRMLHRGGGLLAQAGLPLGLQLVVCYFQSRKLRKWRRKACFIPVDLSSSEYVHTQLLNCSDEIPWPCFSSVREKVALPSPVHSSPVYPFPYTLQIGSPLTPTRFPLLSLTACWSTSFSALAVMRVEKNVLLPTSPSTLSHQKLAVF